MNGLLTAFHGAALDCRLRQNRAAPRQDAPRPPLRRFALSLETTPCPVSFPLCLALRFRGARFDLGFETMPFRSALRRLCKPWTLEEMPPPLARAAIRALMRRFAPILFASDLLAIEEMTLHGSSPAPPASPAPPLSDDAPFLHAAIHFFSEESGEKRFTLHGFCQKTFPAAQLAEALGMERHRPLYPPKLMMALALQIGGTRLTPEERKNLEPGDILFLETGPAMRLAQRIALEEEASQITESAPRPVLEAEA